MGHFYSGDPPGKVGQHSTGVDNMAGLTASRSLVPRTEGTQPATIDAVEDYIGKRQNALQGVDPAELNSRLEAVVSAVGQEWLGQDKSHPLQRLWARRDYLATNELLLLGDAIRGLSALDSNWVADRVRVLRDGDPNNRIGAVFELLGLNYLRVPPQTVLPLRSGTPGYDGTVRFGDGALLHLSLKNYGASHREREVQSHGEEIRSELVTALRMRSATGLGLRIFAKHYPGDDDWKVLTGQLRAHLSSAPLAANIFLVIGDCWTVQLHAIQLANETLSTNHLSYQILLAVPHHSNESKNLIDKLDEARSNCEKHAGPADPGVCRALYLRLPENASARLCADWARGYFAANPTSALDAVILYQPTVSMDLEKDKTVILHHATFVGTSRFIEWQRPAESLQRAVALRFFVGACSATPSQMVLTDGAKRVPADGHYLYQKGDIYTAHSWEPGKTMTASLRNLAPGVQQHSVLTIEGRPMIIQGIFPPSLDLLLYS